MLPLALVSVKTGMTSQSRIGMDWLSLKCEGIFHVSCESNMAPDLSVRLNLKKIMTILKAIIDTNVVFEGLTKQGGYPGLIIDAWAAGLYKACVSNALSYEYEDVLSRKLSNIRWLKIKPALGALLDKAEFVTVWYTWRPASPDPGDDHMIDCALNSGGIIITSNIRDFREAEESLGLTVMTPEGFVTCMAY